MEKIAIFIIFLGPLVFFHELGHFLFARFFGVKVEVFSIGFGPKLFKFKKGDTEYTLSLIPLGGYVKMFGDNPFDEKELTPEEEAVAYTRKSKWARFWIVFGGPLANFVMAFCIYFSLLAFGEKVPEIKFGKIPTEHDLFAKGVRSGDVLVEINEQEISSFDDLNLIDSKLESISVKRKDKKIKLSFFSTGMEFINSFSTLSPELRAPVFVNSKGQSFYIQGVGSTSIEELVESSPKLVVFKQIESGLETKLDIEKIVYSSAPAIKILIKGKFLKSLSLSGFYPRDILVDNIIMNSAADKAKLKKGDIIIAIEGEEILGFRKLRKMVQGVKEGQALKITVLSSGKEKILSLIPTLQEVNGAKHFAIGVYSGAIYNKLNKVESRAPSLGVAFSKALLRTKDGIVKTFLGFKKLITGEVSLKQIGGPLAIGEHAANSFNISLSMFFRLMAIISINLGIINLFPIPVLDGGHIVFIGLEILNRKPLSKKKMQIAQQIGVSFLFLLIFVSLFNDVTRYFGIL